MSMEDWEVANSDENDEPDYLPKSERIISLYSDIAQGKIPTLEVKILSRKDPSLIKPRQPEEMAVDDSEPKELEIAAFDEANEFDFDSQMVDTVKRFTPKHAPSKAQVKKVARIDQVCSKINKYNKLDAKQNTEKIT